MAVRSFCVGQPAASSRVGARAQNPGRGGRRAPAAGGRLPVRRTGATARGTIIQILTRAQLAVTVPTEVPILCRPHTTNDRNLCTPDNAGSTKLLYPIDFFRSSPFRCGSALCVMHTLRVLFSALLAAISIVDAHTQPPALLTPSDASSVLLAIPNGAPLMVTVDSLQPHSSYELRVNYIGTVWRLVILDQSAHLDNIERRVFHRAA